MAKLDRKHCPVCNKATTHINGRCSDCRAEEKSLHRREHFGKLSALTVEERLHRIEEQLYNMSQNPPWIEPTY